MGNAVLEKVKRKWKDKVRVTEKLVNKERNYTEIIWTLEEGGLKD